MKPPAVHPPRHRRKAKPAASAPLTRPMGVSLLGAIHLALGGLMIGLSLLVVGVIPNHGLLQHQSSIPSQILLLIGLFGSVIFAAGLGMLLRHRWGWWWAAFSYAWTIFDSLFALAHLGWLKLSAHAGPSIPLTNPMRQLGQIAVSAAILFYLFRPQVLAWFYQAHLHIRATLVLLGIVAVVLVAAFYTFLFLAGLPTTG